MYGIYIYIYIDGDCFREREVFGDGSKKSTFYEASVNIATTFPCAEVLRDRKSVV